MINIVMKDLKISFNEKMILTPAEKFQYHMLAQFGGYCRRTIINSCKTASSPFQHSKPGDPPFNHGTYKNTVFFVVDKKAKDVTIGGALLSGTAARGQPVPGILEHGGYVVSAKDKQTKYVAPRPHAQPAFEKTMQRKLAGLIRGGIMRAAA